MLQVGPVDDTFARTTSRQTTQPSYWGSFDRVLSHRRYRRSRRRQQWQRLYGTVGVSVQESVAGLIVGSDTAMTFPGTGG